MSKLFKILTEPHQQIHKEYFLFFIFLAMKEIVVRIPLLLHSEPWKLLEKYNLIPKKLQRLLARTALCPCWAVEIGLLGTICWKNWSEKQPGALLANVLDSQGMQEYLVVWDMYTLAFS